MVTLRSTCAVSLYAALLVSSVAACGSKPDHGGQPATGEPARTPTRDAAMPASSAPAASGPDDLTAAERETVERFVRFFTDLFAHSRRVAAALKGANGDCDKAAAALLDPALDASELDRRARELDAAALNPAQRAKLDSETEALRASAAKERPFAELEVLSDKCRDNPAWQRAMKLRGYPARAD